MEELKLADETGNYTTTWKTIHSISGKDTTCNVKVKKRDGQTPLREQDLLEKWNNYFCSLLNSDSAPL